MDEPEAPPRVVWYRVWGDVYEHAGPALTFREYEVVRETEKSVYLRLTYLDVVTGLEDLSKLKRVQKIEPGEGGRRWAYPTKELAIASFIQRKMRQGQHLRRQLDRADALHDYATRWVAAGMKEPPKRPEDELSFLDEHEICGEELLK